MCTMNISLPDQLAAFIEQEVAAGTYLAERGGVGRAPPAATGKGGRAAPPLPARLHPHATRGAQHRRPRRRPIHPPRRRGGGTDLPAPRARTKELASSA